MESTGIVVAFWVLSAVTIGASLAVFLSRDLVHAIVFLILAFLGMAGLFVTLSADFIAVAQVLIYAGAISVLLVFAVMLTPLASRDNGNSLYVVPGVISGLAIAALVGFVSFEADWAALSGAAADERAYGATVEVIGDLLIGRYVLAFEIASVLLLFALLGAIVLVHERTGDAVEVEPGPAGGELARESREPV